MPDRRDELLEHRGALAVGDAVEVQEGLVGVGDLPAIGWVVTSWSWR